MKQYSKSLLVFMVFLALFETALVVFVCLKQPLYGDEPHFYQTIRYFGENLNLHTLKHYPEMITPLSFILYSLWGHLFGFEIHILRILSIILAVTTYLLFHRLLYLIFEDSKIAVLSSIFIILNPYMIGLNCFVYTDMLGILCIIATCLAVYRNNAAIFMISAAAAVLCRQYFIFLTAGAFVYYFITFLVHRRYQDLKMMLSGVVSLVPFLCLVVLWQGLAPDNEIRRINMSTGFNFHPSFLTLYTCQLFLYLLPVVLLCWKPLYKNGKALGVCLIISPIYWLFPVRPSKVLTDGNIFTVGFFHRALRYVLNNTLFEDMAFYLLFYCGLVIFYYFIRDSLNLLRKKNPNYILFLYLCIFMFFLVQPFSYVSWEKYFIPIIPLVSIPILRSRFPEKALPRPCQLPS